MQAIMITGRVSITLPKVYGEVFLEFNVKLLPLPQPNLLTRTYAQTYPSAQRATKLKIVLARVYSVSRQNLNTTTVP
jgi:hypothetical protein